jgi:integrase
MITLKEAFLQKYPDNGKVCDMYEIATGSPMDWDTVTKANLSKLVNYMQENVAASSVRQYGAKLKSVLNLYSDQIDLPRGWQKILTTKNDVSESTYLNEDEIRKIINWNPENLTEAIVQQQFILGALTGSRHSDYQRFTEENIIGDRLVYVSQKTHIRAEVPLSPVVERILRNGKVCNANKYPFAYRQTVCDNTFNNTIRTICRNCFIDTPVKLYRRGKVNVGEKWQFISSHSCRKSAVTNMYKRCRDLFLISKIVGHASVTQTEKYVCIGLEDIPDNVMGYFNEFT